MSFTANHIVAHMSSDILQSHYPFLLLYCLSFVCMSCTRMLGYTDAVLATTSASSGRGTGRIWMGNVQCQGNETRLELCSFSGWGIRYCYPDAGVVCDSECVCVCVCVCDSVCVCVCVCGRGLCVCCAYMYVCTIHLVHGVCCV